MGFGGREADFREVDRRYAELERQHAAGAIGDEEYEEQRRRLTVVQDEAGRWWGRVRETGEWHYRDGGAWVPGTPPGYPIAPGGPAARTEPSARPTPRKRKAVLGAAAAAFAGVAWVVFVALIVLLLSGLRIPEPVLDAAFIVALAGTLGGLSGLHRRQEPDYGRVGAAGFLAAFAGTTLVLISFVLILES